MMDGIQNAVVDCAYLCLERGMVSGWVNVKYNSCTGQGFGGLCLYNGPKKSDDGEGIDYTGIWVYNVMKILDITNFEDAPGKAIRVKLENGLIKSIGHIIEDKWFDPAYVYAGRR